MFVLLEQWTSGEYYVSENTEVYYKCSGTITDILTAISSEVKRQLKNIKSDTFKVVRYECITVECELRTMDPEYEYENVHWCIVPLDGKEILLW